MSIEARYASATEARKAHWFSRRHQDSAAHHAAQDKWRKEREQKRIREEVQREGTRQRKDKEVLV